jgi:hypothetical protein
MWMYTSMRVSMRKYTDFLQGTRNQFTLSAHLSLSRITPSELSAPLSNIWIFKFVFVAFTSENILLFK